MRFNPADDGLTHVNVYSRAKTVGGRWASNFSYTPFTHPRHGDFDSIEGLWYWLSTRDDRLRHTHGFEAKRLGRELRGANWVVDDMFKFDVLDGIRAKLDIGRRSPPQDGFLDLVRTRHLPLMHYYVFASRVHDETARCQWMLDEFVKARGTP